MRDSNTSAVHIALDDRHKKIEAFDPAGAKRVAYPEWGTVPYERIDVARYISPEHVALEAERLWPNVWHVACREEEIPKTGDYVEHQIDDQSILVVRTPSGAIKGFHNACLHRGTQLAKGCGHLSQFVCPFHGWRWGLDGTNRYVHDRVDFPGLTTEELKLPECQVGSWGGFVFVKLTEGGPSLEEFLQPVAEQMAPYNLQDYRIKFWRTVVLPANWKAALEAFEEVYHLMGTHPQSMKGNCDVDCSYEAYGPHSRMIVPVGVPSARFRGNVSEMDVLSTAIDNLLDLSIVGEAERDALEGLRTQPLPEGETTRGLFQKMSQMQYKDFMPDIPLERYMDDWDYTIFPNLVFNLFPGSFLGFTAKPNGKDPDSCVFEVIALVHPGGQEVEPVAREFVTDPEFDWGVVLAQDFANMPRVQQGMHQKSIKQTRLAGYQEMRIVNRFRGIDQYYEKYEGETSS